MKRFSEWVDNDLSFKDRKMKDQIQELFITCSRNFLTIMESLKAEKNKHLQCAHFIKDIICPLVTLSIER